MTNVSSGAMPPEKTLIGDVSLILLPKYPATERDTLRSILHAYPEMLGVQYLPVAESANWTLYRTATAK